MEHKNEMPITFQMALAHNSGAFNAFMKMDNDTQNNILNEAKNQKTLREMNIFVESIAEGVENVKNL